MTTMSDLTFRIATPSDVSSLVALVQSAYRGEDSRAGWTTEADLVSGDRIDVAGVLAKITAPNGLVLMAFDSSTSSLLACCEVLRTPEPSRSAYLGLFSVNPKLQNGGIGRKVLAEAERRAKDQLGAVQMEMSVLWMRNELIAWYERRGYKVIPGETKPFPYEHLPATARTGAQRQDLYFKVLMKDLV